MRKLYLHLLALLVSAAVLAACASQKVKDVPDRTEQRLTVYTSHWREVYGPIIKEFEERTGIWVTVHEGGSIELMELLTLEQDGPVCDVLFGGGADSHELYRDLFEPYVCAGEDAIHPAFRSSGNAWTAFSALPLVIVYNTKLVRNIPDEWQDLLSPEWKGRIACVSPKVSASACTALTTLALACSDPPQRTIRLFLENLDGRYLESSSDVVPYVADGQFALGLTLEEAAFRQINQGKELAICYPNGGTSAVPDALSLVKGAPHPENAKAFIDFAVSQELQQMMVSELGRRSVRTDVSAPEALPKLDEIPLLDYAISRDGTFRESIFAQWDEIVERTGGQ